AERPGHLLRGNLHQRLLPPERTDAQIRLQPDDVPPGPVRSEADGKVSRSVLRKRRRRDSNSRDPCGPTGFQDRRIRPLCHSSGDCLLILFSAAGDVYIRRYTSRRWATLAISTISRSSSIAHTTRYLAHSNAPNV